MISGFLFLDMQKMRADVKERAFFEYQKAVFGEYQNLRFASWEFESVRRAWDRYKLSCCKMDQDCVPRAVPVMSGNKIGAWAYAVWDTALGEWPIYPTCAQSQPQSWREMSATALAIYDADQRVVTALEACVEPDKCPSDIHEHIVLLRELLMRLGGLLEFSTPQNMVSDSR